MRIAFLGSGDLGLVVLNKLKQQYNILLVFTDKASQGIIRFCATNNIQCFIGNPRNKKALHIINDIEIDVLLSVNYLFLIEMDLIDWPKLYAINFHGSLLPKYRGRTPHVWAIINNEKVTGITAHLIDMGCDTGPIVDQILIPLEDEDSGASILNKYLILYPDFVRRVVKMVIDNKIKPVPQDHSKATYYSKRTQDDGQINWHWQKERIRNWVRAQAFPYPGAFTFYNQTKVIINKVVFSDEGYMDTAANGIILKVESGMPIVKTQNGALQIVDFQSVNELTFKEGEMFL